MKFIWEQLIELIECAFETNKSSIAISLGVNKSTITRLSQGKTSKFSKNATDIYKIIFSPTNPKSLAYEKYPDITQEEREATLLDVFKEIIRLKGWSNAIKTIESNKYEDFVRGLIELALSNSHKLSKKEENSKDILPTDLPNINDNSTKISIPSQYRKCLYCTSFKSDTVYKNNANLQGICISKCQKKAASNPACGDFEANEGKIMKEMLTPNLSFHNEILRNKFHL